jgi:RHS repeat-associated protein
VGADPVMALGAVTGQDGGWQAAGWRLARPIDLNDPWLAGVAAGSATGSAGSAGCMVGADGAGGLLIDGLEWLGARVYDPNSFAFLSPDPAEAPVGAAWGSNRYSYAGNNPVCLLDPSGLSPVTDAAVLDQYAAEHAGTMEYFIGGAMIVAGGILISTGVGGPLGGMLIGAGVDAVIQKATTGEVDWGQVAVSGVMSAVGGAAGAAVALRAGASGLGRVALVGAVDGALSGAVTGGYGYMAGPGPHTLQGFGAATGFGLAVGGLTGAGGAAAGHGLTQVGRRLLGMPAATPLSGHGAIWVDDASMFTVPPGTSIRFYSQHGVTIPDTLGNRIETGATWPLQPRIVQTAVGGDVIPDYGLYPPEGLNIMGNPVTVTEPTRLSSLVEPGATYDWAACREVVYP